MSGPVAMYSLKPILPIASLPKQKNVMYEMKNIHENQENIVDHSPFEDTIVNEIKDQVTILLKVFVYFSICRYYYH